MVRLGLDSQGILHHINLEHHAVPMLNLRKTMMRSMTAMGFHHQNLETILVLR
jgi:hypothetical protein